MTVRLRPPASVPVEVVRLQEGKRRLLRDVVAAEEPLEVRLLWQDGVALQRRSIAVTMRTPGDDFELAVGFLYGEGILRRRDDVADVSYCLDEQGEQQLNVVTVTLRPGIEFDVTRLERNFYTTSSCGVCGKASIESVEVQGCHVLEEGGTIAASVLERLPDALREAQAVFAQTGGLHAAGLFDFEGNLLLMKEDVGRHNAVDKVIGHCFLEDMLPLSGRVLMLSGRASFELVQKAVVARVPVVAAVGAPSSLAVELARSFNVTLAGFVRRNGFNVYSAEQRIAA